MSPIIFPLHVFVLVEIVLMWERLISFLKCKIHGGELILFMKCKVHFFTLVMLWFANLCVHLGQDCNRYTKFAYMEWDWIGTIVNV